MSFRRSKSIALEARGYRNFLQANTALLQASGVPESIYVCRELFDDLLMHGYIDHHPDPTRFFVGRLTEAQRAALVELVVRYLRAGFPDPGIGGFMGSRMHDEIIRRVERDTEPDAAAGDEQDSAAGT